eukprot:gene9866-6938_t
MGCCASAASDFRDIYAEALGTFQLIPKPADFTSKPKDVDIGRQTAISLCFVGSVKLYEEALKSKVMKKLPTGARRGREWEVFRWDFRLWMLGMCEFYHVLDLLVSSKCRTTFQMYDDALFELPAPLRKSLAQESLAPRRKEAFLQEWTSTEPRREEVTQTYTWAKDISQIFFSLDNRFEVAPALLGGEYVAPIRDATGAQVAVLDLSELEGFLNRCQENRDAGLVQIRDYVRNLVNRARSQPQAPRYIRTFPQQSGYQRRNGNTSYGYRPSYRGGDAQDLLTTPWSLHQSC